MKISTILLWTLLANALALVLPWAIKIIIDDVLIKNNTDYLNLLMIVLIGVLAARSLFSFLRTFMSSQLGEKIVCDLQKRICEHIPRLSLISINQMTPAQILTRITQDVESVRRFLFRDTIEFIYSLLNIGFILIILFFVNPKLAAVALCVIPLFSALYVRLIPELKERNKRLRDVYGLLSSRMNEVLNGIRVVRSLAKDTDEIILFKHKQREILNVAGKMHYLNSWLWVGVEFFTSLGIIGILWIGGRDVMAGRMSAGELIAFYAYLGMFFAPMIRMVVINTSYLEAQAAVNRINDIMNIRDEVSYVASSKDLRVRGALEFEHVHFHYAPDKPILKDISFTVRPGESIGIVGASGVGKTTLISLLVRFFDPASGNIKIDGNNLKDLDLKRYRRQIAVVLQDDFLFSGTIEDNIKYGVAHASQQDIIRAAKIAGAHDFISSLGNNYKTEIGERGYNFSSGQRQRIALARAVIKDPAILILDEATSAVDALTENDIQQSVRQAMKGKTIMIVAHRFSTIMECDKIIVLDQGKIVEMGDHNYLLNKKGFYSNLYLEQFKEKDKVVLTK